MLDLASSAQLPAFGLDLPPLIELITTLGDRVADAGYLSGSRQECVDGDSASTDRGDFEHRSVEIYG